MTDSARPSILAPSWDVRIDGKAVTEDLVGRLLALTVEDDLEAPAMLEVVLAGDARSGGALQSLIEDDRFTPGAEIAVDLGLRDAPTLVFKGEIAALEPEFRASGPSTLTIRAYDGRQKLRQGVRGRTFTGVSDAEVVRTLAQAAGLTAETPDAGRVHAYLIQTEQSDFDFLLSRAAATGFEILMQDGRLIYRRPALDAASIGQLQLFEDLLEFSASLSVAGQASAVVSRAWSAAEGKALVGRAAAGDERKVMGGSSAADLTRKALKRTVEITHGRSPAVDQAEVDELARARFETSGLALIEAEAVVLGSPDIRPGRVISIDGVGRKFSGDYYIVAATHRLAPGPGFITEFRARRNAA